jgi:hypothetical protein
MTQVPASAEPDQTHRRIADVASVLEASWQYAQPPFQDAMAKVAAKELRELGDEPTTHMQRLIGQAGQQLTTAQVEAIHADVVNILVPGLLQQINN